MIATALKYRPRTPEKTVLYELIEENFPAFINELSAKDKNLPAYVEEEFKAFLDCGQLKNGFARLKCSDCGHEKLLALSCKRRGFCPSCCGRRMNEAEMRIIEEIFPVAPARQWVLSLPMPLRFLCARDRPLLNILVNIFHKTVSQFIQKRLREKGYGKSKTGGILVIQRLGGALNLNVHFHAIFLDGGFSYDEKTKKFLFCELSDSISSQDVADVLQKVAMRVFKEIQKHGYIIDGEQSGSIEPDGAALCDAASVKNMIAFGERAGQPVRRIRVRTDQEKARICGDRVAEFNWFNLKADKVVKSHQRWKLARLVRYITRPPLAHERLDRAEDGTVRYKMKKPWSDGTVEIQLSGVELIEKLAAAVPPPRGHLIRYFGVLAPNSKIRPYVVLVPKPKARDENGKLKSSAVCRKSWAELAKHTFKIDLTKCELCGGSVRRLAVIRNPVIIRKILAHLQKTAPRETRLQLIRLPPSVEPTYDHHF